MKPHKKVVEQPETPVTRKVTGERYVPVTRKVFGARRFTIEEELQKFGEETVKQMNEEIEEELQYKFNQLLRRRSGTYAERMMKGRGTYAQVIKENEYGIFVSETMSGYCEDVAELIQYIMLAEQNEERYMMKCPNVWVNVLKALRIEYR